MTERFWDGFVDELPKAAAAAHLNPIAARPLARLLGALAKAGLFGLAAYAGYKGLASLGDVIDELLWFPQGERRRFA